MLPTASSPRSHKGRHSHVSSDRENPPPQAEHAGDGGERVAGVADEDDLGIRCVGVDDVEDAVEPEGYLFGWRELRVLAADEAAATGGRLTANEEGFQHVLGTDEAPRLLEEFAAFTAAISRRLGPLQLVLEQGAGTDLDLADLMESSQRRHPEAAKRASNSSRSRSMPPVTQSMPMSDRVAKSGLPISPMAVSTTSARPSPCVADRQLRRIVVAWSSCPPQRLLRLAGACRIASGNSPRDCHCACPAWTSTGAYRAKRPGRPAQPRSWRVTW